MVAMKSARRSSSAPNRPRTWRGSRRGRRPARPRTKIGTHSAERSPEIALGFAGVLSKLLGEGDGPAGLEGLLDHRGAGIPRSDSPAMGTKSAVRPVRRSSAPGSVRRAAAARPRRGPRRRSSPATGPRRSCGRRRARCRNGRPSERVARSAACARPRCSAGSAAAIVESREAPLRRWRLSLLGSGQPSSRPSCPLAKQRLGVFVARPLTLGHGQALRRASARTSPSLAAQGKRSSRISRRAWGRSFCSQRAATNAARGRLLGAAQQVGRALSEGIAVAGSRPGSAARWPARADSATRRH